MYSYFSTVLQNIYLAFAWFMSGVTTAGAGKPSQGKVPYIQQTVRKALARGDMRYLAEISR